MTAFAASFLIVPLASAPSVSAERSPVASRTTSHAAAIHALRSTISDRRTATWRHQDYLGYQRTRSAFRERMSAATEYLRWIRRLWSQRAHRYWRLTLVTLRDFEVAPGNHAWPRAVREAERIFPGTASWNLSCSASEGGWGRWVRYGGGAYYSGYENTDEVGNWLQFRWSTFKPFYRRALEVVRQRGYRVPLELRDHENVRAWLSPLATALAGGWAITNGMRHHWAGHGC